MTNEIPQFEIPVTGYDLSAEMLDAASKLGDALRKRMISLGPPLSHEFRFHPSKIEFDIKLVLNVSEDGTMTATGVLVSQAKVDT